MLADWLSKGRIPSAIDVPTGLGKTTVMAIWLAARAIAPAASLPRRFIYVVDRRAVVDQATIEAAGLRERLGIGERPDAAIGAIRGALGLRPGQWLAVSTLRGQLAGNRDWLDDPAAPGIVVGTVDMIGSRLLFEGYGVGRKMRPVHAGLLGADALVALDEAHLVPPFQALLEQVVEQQRRQAGRSGAPDRGIVPRLRAMALTATGRNMASSDVFRLTAEQRADPPVMKRLTAVKRLRVLDEVPAKDLTARLVERAKIAGKDGGAVLIYCNSRMTAQDVYSKLPEGAAALLVGERRVLERALLTHDPIYRRFLPGPDRLGGDGPAFMVATSAGEVGLDLDADHIVCDLVTWERMVQRLGRLNRRAEPGVADIDVVPVRSDKKDEAAETLVADDVRLAELRAALDLLPESEPGTRDASPAAILALRAAPAAAAVLTAATSQEPLRPALTQAVIEAWALTSLEHHAGRPLVVPWIRGWVDDPPQTTVLWRRRLPAFAEGDRAVSRRARLATLKAYFEAAPPHLTETLEAPTVRLIDMLKKRIEAWATGDEKRSEPFLVVLDTSGTVKEELSLADVKQDKLTLVRRLAGRTLVIDARLGGLDLNGLLDAGAGEPATWDAATPAVDDAPGWTDAMLRSVGRRVIDAGIGDRPDRGWVREAGWPLNPDPDTDDDDGRELRIERLRTAPAAGDASRSTAQALEAHHHDTASEARRIADALLPLGPLRELLVLVAGLHDLGKDREAWQNAMGAEPKGRPWAKTDGRRADLAILKHYRHEFGSLRDAEATIRAAIADPALQDLALHLIAAHHGHARPVIVPHDPDDPPTLSEARARDAALRYARLQRQWGPWGLAWWESLIRTADWAASRAAAEAGQ